MNDATTMLVRHLHGYPVRQRVTDGYLDATALCAIYGKRWFNYRRLKSTTEFLKVTESAIHLCAALLVQSVEGGPYHSQGTWVHPDIAVHLAQWCAPTCVPQVTSWVRDWKRQQKSQALRAQLDALHRQGIQDPIGQYDVLVIDPPWPVTFNLRDVRPQQVDLAYPRMTLDAIQALRLPMAPDCHVWLWTTHRFLPEGFACLAAWGLDYVCCFVWQKPGGMQPLRLPQFRTEFALYARHGHPQFIDTTDFTTSITAPRTGHSAKPEAFYAMVRRVTAGRRCDMFARRAIAGFDAWGAEAPYPPLGEEDVCQPG